MDVAVKYKYSGVAGEGKPLSWQSDLPLKEIVKDSLYSTTLTVETGYLFSEVKFTVNGEFELQDKDNRRVIYDKSKKRYIGQNSTKLIHEKANSNFIVWAKSFCPNNAKGRCSTKRF
ncbi:MAG: hypothetical protein U5M51_12520 [Emticicia sp.]|nr:hypothetical protein [Emticicia sp.]